MSLSSLELLMQKTIESKIEKSSKSAQNKEIEELKLSFAFQNLSEIDPKILPINLDRIRILDLTENNFTGSNDLRFIFPFTNLKTLILDKNQIQSNIKLPFMPSLETLWLNHNNIENLSIFIENILQSCPNLVYLSMINNKAAPSYFNGGSLAEYNDYRQYVISKLSKLKMLDSKEITAEERAQATSIYGITRSGKAKNMASAIKSRRQSEVKKTYLKRHDKNVVLQENNSTEQLKSNKKFASSKNSNVEDTSFIFNSSKEKEILPENNNKDFDPTSFILPDLDKDKKFKQIAPIIIEVDSFSNVENIDLPPISSTPPSLSTDAEFESLPDLD